MSDGGSVDSVFSENIKNDSMSRMPATTEGMAVAYGSLIIMALFPIFFGSIRAVKHHKEQKVTMIALILNILLFHFASLYNIDQVVSFIQFILFFFIYILC